MMKNKKHKETKGMKKILAMVLVGVIGMCIFTGCGKSEEEKAMDEIADHLRDEAAADGVDIDKMVEEEAEKYNAELEAGNKEIANMNDLIESLKNNEMVPLREQSETYFNATDSETAKKAAEEFNKAYDKYLEAAIGEYFTDEYDASELLRQNDIHRIKITDSELQTRVNYLDNCYGKNYNRIRFYGADSEIECLLMYNETDDQIVSDVTLIYNDGRSITPDLSSIGKPVQGVEFVVNKNDLIITDYTWGYEFTVDSPAGTSIGNADGSPIFPEGEYSIGTELWENTIEEYNSKME